MIHTSPLPPVEIPDLALTPFVMRHARDLAGKPALIDGPTDRTLTYGELDAAIRRFAGGLVARGFAKGDVLALMAPNCPEYAVVFHGVALAGGIVTTINPTYTDHEVNHQLTDSGASILVTIDLFLDTARKGAEGTGVTETFVIGDARDGVPSVLDLFGEPLAAQVPVAPDDVVALPYSSGTTGLAKGVMLTHRNLVANIVQASVPTEVAEHDVLMAVLPFFHIYGMQIPMNAGLAAGATVITMPRFDLELFLELHQKHRITLSFVAPPIVLALAKHPVVDRYDLSSLTQVLSGAAPLSGDLALEASARIGCEVVQGYGMTELSPVSHLTPRGQFKPGSCGVTAPNTETRVVGADGNDLGLEEDGEVWVRGPQVMKGYLNNPRATADTLDADGWLRTGDIGHFDADGHLYVVDRLKELIKYKGFQVPPAELEALLLTHPAVADAAVIGRADAEAGEIPIGFVVLKPGATATAEEIRTAVNGEVAHYKRIAELHVVDAIPKSAAGKILRRVLRDDDQSH